MQAQIGSTRANGGAKTNGNMKAVGRKFDPAAGNKNNPSFDAAMAIMPNERNKRSVWTVNTMPYKGAHFATYPPKLIEPCILAGCPTGGVVLDPFSGAGTTGIVACRLGRNYQGIELNPDYVAMSYHRWEAGCAAEERVTDAEREGRRGTAVRPGDPSMTHSGPIGALCACGDLAAYLLRLAGRWKRGQSGWRSGVR